MGFTITNNGIHPNSKNSNSDGVPRGVSKILRSSCLSIFSNSSNDEKRYKGNEFNKKPIKNNEFDEKCAPGTPRH